MSRALFALRAAVVVLLAWLCVGCNPLPFQAARPTAIPTRDKSSCDGLIALRNELEWSLSRFEAARTQIGNAGQLQATADEIGNHYSAVNEQHRKAGASSLSVEQVVVADALLNARSVFYAWVAGRDGQREAVNYLTELKKATEIIGRENRFLGCW